MVAITPAAMRALDAIRPAGAGDEVKVFGLAVSQIARRVKVIAKAAGLADWEFFSGHSGRVGMARRMAQNGAPTHEIERQGRWKQGGGEVKVFGLAVSQIARRVKVIAKAAGLADWEFFSGHSGRVGMARRMAQNGAPTHEIERQGRWKQGGGMVGRYTRGESAGSALRYL